MADDDRDCLWCGKTLVQREDESLSSFKLRDYCGKSHAATHTNSLKKPKKRNISCFLSPLYL
ncbi:hypothetical protein UFOVP1419_57 [uncultured Caudovirales phage]|uniref:Uncharacterized protein n=1 Tax=uncultured Caudovirales phage TaxID=2100421 RepID=A0A6J5SDZ8_9CAUD|nr:hypothetical protein UFOVP1419_57 [uncultured Caudovirales phage]